MVRICANGMYLLPAMVLSSVPSALAKWLCSIHYGLARCQSGSARVLRIEARVQVGLATDKAQYIPQAGAHSARGQEREGHAAAGRL